MFQTLTNQNAKAPTLFPTLLPPTHAVSIFFNNRPQSFPSRFSNANIAQPFHFYTLCPNELSLEGFLLNGFRVSSG